MVLRVLAGFVAIWMTLGSLLGLYHGQLILGLFSMWLAGVFLIYAIGGNKLIQRIFPAKAKGVKSSIDN